MAVERPYTLTLTQANNPHRTAPHTHVPQSYLEESFSRGNLEEIEYWIQSGVVAQALAGQSNSRRDYATSLMEYFSLWLADRHTVSEPERVNKIIETLWEGGAKDKVERHATWLARMVVWPIADRLLDRGVNPWDAARVLEIPQKSGPPKRYVRSSNHSEFPNAMLAGLHALVYAEENIGNTTLGTDKEQLAWLEARVERMFGSFHTPGRDELQQALGLVTRGGLKAEIAQAMQRRDDDPWRRREQEQRVRQWTRWRDRLLAKGASALMGPGDALDELISVAPSEPLNRWQIHGLEYKLANDLRMEQAKSQGVDWWTLPLPAAPEERTNEIMLDLLGRRALGWQQASQRWLDALDEALSRPLDERDQQKLYFDNGAANGARWGKLLDAPGGLDLARRLARKLSERGQPLPWSPLNRSLSSARMQELVAINGYRSLRRLAQVKQLLEDPGLTPDGVLPAWRAELAHTFLRAEPSGDSPQSPVPGMTLGTSSELKPRMYRPPSNTLGLPTGPELDLLLDLAGPDIMGVDLFSLKMDSDAHWVVALFSQLPKMWEERNTPQEERQAVLDVLARRGVMDKIILSLTCFTIEGLVRPAQYSILEILELERQGEQAKNLWLNSWKKAETLSLLETTLERHCKPETRQVLERLLAWDRIAHYPQMLLTTRSAEEEVRHTQALTCVSKECPILIDRMAGLLGMRICSKENNSGRWDAILHHLGELNVLAQLGWKPREESDPTYMILKALGMESPSEEQQQLAIGLLKPLGPINEVGGAFLTCLMELEEQRGTDRMGWKESIDMLIESGAFPSISGESLVSGTLRAHIVSSVRRRLLANVAREVGADPDSGSEVRTPKRRL